MSTIQIPLASFCTLDQKHADDNLNPIFYVGQMYSSGTKGHNYRGLAGVDVATPLTGWTGLTSAKLVAEVTSLVGGSFKATLRQVIELFTYTQATWNQRVTGTNWGTAGAGIPLSATDTNKIMFNSPGANGWQDIVTGMLTLINVALAGDGTLRFQISSDNEDPGSSQAARYVTPYLEVEGTPPAGASVPIVSDRGVHSLAFGGQVVR